MQPAGLFDMRADPPIQRYDRDAVELSGYLCGSRLYPVDIAKGSGAIAPEPCIQAGFLLRAAARETRCAA